MKDKKGQIESIGLVIIVILLVIIGLISLIFILNNDNSREDNKFLTIKANNMMNALYNSDMDNDKFRNLMSSCCGGVEEDCRSIREYFEDISLEIDENMSLIINKEYFSGENCQNFVSSTSYSYPGGCTTNIRVCK